MSAFVSGSEPTGGHVYTIAIYRTHSPDKQMAAQKWYFSWRTRMWWGVTSQVKQQAETETVRAVETRWGKAFSVHFLPSAAAQTN